MLPPRLIQAMLLIPLSFLAHPALSSANGRDSSRIVNGLTTHNFPTTGALLYDSQGDPDSATAGCSGILIGCETFLTAAHCVEGDLDADNYFILLQHGGIIGATNVTQHPMYVDANFPIADVAVIKLDTQVTGIDPSEINQTDPEPSIPEPGTIVGFGITDGFSDDAGIKRVGAVVTTNCDASVPAGADNTEVVCWDYENPVGPPGDDSNTCSGDSGGPLFLDLGSGQVVAGVTSGGDSNNCTPADHSYDANVYTYRTYVLDKLGADSTSACGSIGEVGDPNTTVLENDGSLSAGNPSESFSFELSAGVAELRVVLNAVDDESFNPDLYVRLGAPATTSSFDCKADGATPHGACSFGGPSAGTWHVLVDRTSGSGEYQTTTTIFGGSATQIPVPLLPEWILMLLAALLLTTGGLALEPVRRDRA